MRSLNLDLLVAFNNLTVKELLCHFLIISHFSASVIIKVCIIFFPIVLFIMLFSNCEKNNLEDFCGNELFHIKYMQQLSF